MTAYTAGTLGEADELRGAMVDEIVALQGPRLELGRDLPATVVAALRTVPRHLFTPGVPLARAYKNTTVITKTNERGVNLSSESAAWAVGGAPPLVGPGGRGRRAGVG